MKAPRTRVPFIIFLLMATFVVIGSNLIVSAQDCIYPTVWPWPKTNSWWPDHTVHVLIDDRFNEVDRLQLTQGFVNWSLWESADCSYVTFYGFETMNFSGVPYAQMPPDYTVWVVQENPKDGAAASGERRFGGGFYPLDRVIAQKINSYVGLRILLHGGPRT
jgi:hypothetical protein